MVEERSGERKRIRVYRTLEYKVYGFDGFDIEEFCHL
jgi:hypothetical protein